MSGPRQEAADTYRNVDITTLTFRFVTTFHFLISVTLSSISLIFAVVCLRKDIDFHELSKIYKNNIFQKLHFRVSIQGYRHKTHQPSTAPSHLAAAISICNTAAQTHESLPVHNDSHPTRLNVIQPSRAPQSKTSHTATKKNFWLSAQLFPYQSAN